MSKTPAHNPSLIFWNFFLSVVFLAIFISLTYILESEKGLPNEIKVFEFVLIALAVFRLTRLFVADEVSDFFRAFFQDKKKKKLAGGKSVWVVEDPKSGIRLSIIHLLSCLWCTGMWVSMFVVFGYFYFPWAWFVVFAFAVAGLASFIHLAANATGWTAESLMKRTEGGN